MRMTLPRSGHQEQQGCTTPATCSRFFDFLFLLSAFGFLLLLHDRTDRDERARDVHAGDVTGWLAHVARCRLNQ